MASHPNKTLKMMPAAKAPKAAVPKAKKAPVRYSRVKPGTRLPVPKGHPLPKNSDRYHKDLAGEGYMP